MKYAHAIVESAKDLKPDEIYYEYIYSKARVLIRTYDYNTYPLRAIEVKYTDAIRGLQRIVSKDNLDMLTKTLYTLKPINNQFYKVMKNDMTSTGLLACANTLNKWKR